MITWRMPCFSQWLSVDSRRRIRCFVATVHAGQHLADMKRREDTYMLGSFNCAVSIVLSTILIALQSTKPVDGPKIQTSIIPVSALPQQFDEERVFEYMYAKVDPESVLTELWKADIPVAQAWLPLDNLCMDPRGPRFTVDLTKVDVRIAEFQFTHGSGRLHCATMLKRYVISD